MGNCCGTLVPNTHAKDVGIRLGSGSDEFAQSSGSTQHSQMQVDERQRALDAAEERRQAHAGKGKLARKLQEQNAIGPGRAVDTSSASGPATMTWKADV